MAKVLGKPESSSDVVNKQPKVLLIGYGWVNQYMAKYFTEANYITSEGIYRRVSDGQPTTAHDTYSLAIVGVPTPMNKETGQCDTSIVEEVINRHRHMVRNFLIKSTVEIGTTDKIASSGVRVAMSPEYVGETLGHPLLEPRRDAFQIIGGEPDVAEEIASCFQKVLHASAPIYLCTAIEAEIIKYGENFWITQRVDYWNDMKDIADAFGASFQRVREGLVLDPRLGRTHSFVYDNNRGWSGKCLPKDMNALAYTMRKKRKPLPLLEHMIEKNVSKWRKNYDNKETLIPKKPLWTNNIIRTGFEND